MNVKDGERHEDKIYRMECGAEAKRIEQAVVKTLRRTYGLPPFLNRRDMPNGLFTTDRTS
jgi:hypothetical protein